MRTFTLPHYIVVGLLVWGLPGFFVLGFEALLITVFAAVPIIALSAPRIDKSRRLEPLASDAVLFATVLFAYVLFDALWGRQKLELNLFLNELATDSYVESANAMLTRGRGFIELLGSMLVIAPFVLIDFGKKTNSIGRTVLLLVAAIFILYDAGIGRAYLFMSVIAVTFGATANRQYRVWGVFLGALLFMAASVARGADVGSSFLNPVEEGVVWPFRNLDLLIYSYCGDSSTIAFISEIAKKFIPSFIIDKNIFSFNIEMTNCIYPYSVYNFDSISIFTWLGEMKYYKPSLLTALISGLAIAIIARSVERMLDQMQLSTTRFFVGFLCIALLRSRILDVITLLIFSWILLWFVSIWLRRRTFQVGSLG